MPSYSVTLYELEASRSIQSVTAACRRAKRGKLSAPFAVAVQGSLTGVGLVALLNMLHLLRARVHAVSTRLRRRMIADCGLDAHG